MTRTMTQIYSEVVLPVDFTSLGWRALPVAEQLAAGFRAPLRLLHVDTAAPWSDAEPGLLQLHASALGRSVQVQVAPDRDVALGLGRAIAGRDALVAMSSHARAGAAELFVDSSLERVVRVLDVPVIVCGPRTRDDGAPLSRIVLCVDAAAPPDELLRDVSDWARHLTLPVEVLTVVATGADEPLDGVRAEEQRLSGVASAFVAEGISASAVVLRGTRPAHEIVGYAAAVPGTVIALATHARMAAARAVVGSVAMKVIRHAAGPVLLRRRDSGRRS